LPQPQRGIAERIDALAAKTLPDLQRAVKWSMAYYGVDGGWCFSSGAFIGHVKLMFIRGTEIKPEPPDAMVVRAPDLLAGAFAVAAARPAARPTLGLLELLLGSANAALSGHRLLGVLDAADELVASQRRDVLPGIERRGVGDQSLRRSSGSLCTTPPGTFWPLTRPR
jgi:hypothetical protein